MFILIIAVVAQALQLPSIHVPENGCGDQAVSLLATSQANKHNIIHIYIYIYVYTC